jgi:hypothetical protein
MSADELSVFIRDNKIEFFGPTPESEAEAGWEAKLFEAIESGDLGRGKPGPQTTRTNDYRQLRLECLREFPNDEKRAKARFIKRSGAKPRRAQNVWSLLKTEDEK